MHSDQPLTSDVLAITLPAVCYYFKMIPRCIFSIVFAVAAAQSPPPDFIAKHNQPFPPYRVMENIYYVGTNDMTMFLITTPEGHILINTGFEESVPLVKASVEKLGFRFSDIKIILISHAHNDHVAGIALAK